MPKKTNYNPQIYTTEKIFEELQMRAEDNPAIFNLKQETAAEIKAITGCCAGHSFTILKEIEDTYDFKTVGTKNIYGSKELLASIGVKHIKGPNTLPENRLYYAGIQYLYMCRNMNKEPQLKEWLEKYLKRHSQ